MERFEIDVKDLHGMWALHDVRIDLPEVWQEHLAGSRLYTTLFPTGGFATGRSYSLVSIHTGDGTFLLVVDRWYRESRLQDAGFWLPHVLPTTSDPLLVQARIFSTGRLHPFIVMTDERTGLAILELGTKTRRDDDPNSKSVGELAMQFSREGFESRFLALPDDGERVVITRRYEFTPKNPRGGSRKGRF
jgi:hypothetical protein